MDPALISIIVPIYNVERYLHLCIDSIRNQTYTNLEIILVDDGSPDNCPAICDAYAREDHRIKVIHKENGGLSSARNAGLDIATGNYISFVDSDDVIDPEMCQKLYHAISAQQADICFCRVLATTELGEKKENTKYYNVGSASLDGYRVLETLIKHDYSFYEVVWNKLYHRSVFSSIRFPVGRYHEDAFLVHHIYDSCRKIIFLEDALYFYRLRENSILRSTFCNKKIDIVDALLDRVQYCNAHAYSDLAAYAMLQLLGKTLEVWMMIPKNNKCAKQLIRQKIKVFRQLYRTIPTQVLNPKDRIKLFCGAYLPLIYLIKLKLQCLLHK